MNKYLIKQTKDGKLYFTLSASNGRVIATSNLYSSIAALFNGIESVKAHAHTDVIEYEDQSVKKQFE